MLHSFVKSIAYINDSGTFDTSFEVKYIQATPQRQKNRQLNNCDRNNLRRFVEEFEDLQVYNNNNKSTPKKIKALCTNFANVDKTNIGSSDQSSLCSRHNLEQYSFSPALSLPSPILSRSSFPVPEHIGCRSLASCDVKETSYNESLQLIHDIENGTKEASFDEMHSPLPPLFNVTSSSNRRQHQVQRNISYELARLLHGSFHVKHAKITHLRRSVSHNENVHNGAQLKESKTYKTTAKERQKNMVLEDLTNLKKEARTSSICTRAYSVKTSPFRKVWEQSSLRTQRTNNYVLNGKPHSCESRCSAPILASEGDVFIDISPVSKQYTSIKSSNVNKKISMQSEKLTASQNSDVKSWANSFEYLLQEPAALSTFAEFLKLEFSAENIYFWASCERYRNTDNLSDRRVQAKHIFQNYLENGCREPVNLDSYSRNLSEELLQNAERNLFDSAQKQIFHLMKFDSYQRFIRSDLYKSCVQAGEKNQPLPYGAENLDVLLKTDFFNNSSQKLKKSSSNAEDRRRKILLPWHRKTRSKSRDRVDLLSEEKSNANNMTNVSSNVLNNLLLPSSKRNVLYCTLPPQSKPPAQNYDSQVQQNLRTSLPTSLRGIETGCSLCRVKFCDGSTTIVQIKPNETIQQLVERVLEKRALCYKHYEVVIKGRSKAIDLQASTQELAGEEVEIEQRVTFKIYLPDPKVISVKSKPKKYIHEVVTPILQKYSYDLEAVNVLRRDNHKKIDISQLVGTIDGLRLEIVVRIKGDLRTSVDYQNDNVCMKWVKARELASEIVGRNPSGNSFRNSFRSSENNLDEITNSIFNDIAQEKARPDYKQQHTDQNSIKSEECVSDASSIFGATKSKDTHVFPMIHQHSMETNLSSNSSQMSNEFNRPIIAKLKAGVKLHVTERVAEKPDELLLNLKTCLDNQTTIGSIDKTNENDQITAVNLRRVRANLSPVNKTKSINGSALCLEGPQALSTNMLSNKMHLNCNSNETTKQNKCDFTIHAAIKGPPPLPPKPKVIPSKPSNWGFNISDQISLP